jgi:hypothetical protein
METHGHLIYACICVHVYVCVYKLGCVCMYVCMDVCSVNEDTWQPDACMHMYACVCMCMEAWMCMYVCMDVCSLNEHTIRGSLMHVCIGLHVNVCLYMYCECKLVHMHTYIHACMAT